MTVLLKNSVYLHIPKTGGNFARKVILRHAPGSHFLTAPNGNAHLELEPLKRIAAQPVQIACEQLAVRMKSGVFLPPDEKQKVLCNLEPALERFTFTFIRHPISWWESYWRYRMTSGWQSNHSVDKHCASGDYNIFIERVLRHAPGFCSRMFRQFIGRDDAQIQFVGRQENLRGDLLNALQRAGEPVDWTMIQAISPANVSTGVRPLLRRDLVEALIAAEADIIRQYYADRPIPASLPNTAFAS